MATHLRGTGRVFTRARSPFLWIAYYHNGAEIRESAGTADPVKAAKMLRARTRTAGTPQFQGPTEERVTFATLTEHYVQDYRANRRRSLDDAERIANRLQEAFGARTRAVTISTTDVNAYRDRRLAEGARPATINRSLAALRRMYSLACRPAKGRQGEAVRPLLTTRPYVELLDESDNVRQGFIEPEEFTALCADLPADLADAAMFAYASGWRRGEVFTLEWKDLALEYDGDTLVGGVIRLRREHSKNKRGRVLTLRADLLDVIRRRVAARELACVYVFHRAGRRIADFRTTWRKACEAAGVPGRLWHDMRRSAVRNMVRAGVSENTAQKVSGHLTRSVFDRYDVVSEEDIGTAVEAVSAYRQQRALRKPRVTPLREKADTTRTLAPVPKTAAGGTGR